MECTTPSYSMRPFPDGRFLLPFLLLVLSQIHLSVALSTMFNSLTKSIKDRACFVSSENDLITIPIADCPLYWR